MDGMTTSFKKSEGKMTKERFLRNSLIELYSASDATVDIDNIELSDVFTDTAKVATQFTCYDIDSYNVEIGYDHQEQFIEQERRYDSTLKAFVTRDVLKNRTVTHWQPYSGGSETVFGTSFRVMDDGDNIDLGDKDENISIHFDDKIDFKKIISKGSFREVTEKEEKLLKPLTEEEHKLLAYDSVNDRLASGLSLPGDHWRNLNAKWSIRYADAIVYAIDTYKATFDFAGNKCFIKGTDDEEFPRICSAGGGNDKGEEEIKNKEEQTLNADPKFQRLSKIYKHGKTGAYILGVLSVFLSERLGVFSFIGILTAIIGFIYIYNRYGKKAKAMSNEIHTTYENMLNQYKEEQKTKKIELLNARFLKMGMPSLTEKELERFLSENDHKLTDNYSYFDPKELEEEEAILNAKGSLAELEE